METVIKNRSTSCVGVRKTGTTLIHVSTVMGTLYNKDGLFLINVVKGIDDREKSYDDVEERRQLEKVAGMLFG